MTRTPNAREKSTGLGLGRDSMIYLAVSRNGFAYALIKSGKDEEMRVPVGQWNNTKIQEEKRKCDGTGKGRDNK